MTRTVTALALLLALTSEARAETWCITRTGRLRLRPAACFTNERSTTLPRSAALKTVVDRDGDPVGTIAGVATGYELTYGSVFVTRAVGAAVIGLPVNAAGLVPPGSDVLYFTATGCVGEPLVADYDNATNGLVKVGSVWPTAAWYPLAGTGHDTTSDSLLFYVLPGSAPCSDYPTGTPMADGLCCVDTHAPSGRYFTAARFTLADAGLEPPFRLSVEP